MKTEKLKLALVISIITLSVLCVLLILYPYLPQPHELWSRSETSERVSSVVPISFDSPQVSGIFLSYTFTGKVSSLVTEDGSTQLHLSGDPALPIFVLTRQTAIMTVQDPKPPVQVSPDLLKDDQFVSVVAYYDVKNKSWTTTHVYITQEQHGPTDALLP